MGPATDLLARRLALLLLDNRGGGDSDAPPGPYSASDLAADAVAVLDAAGVARAHVVGTSLGGMVAQELALGWPDRVDRLVLVGTTPGGEDAYPTPERTRELLDALRDSDPNDALRTLVENALTPRTATERPDLVDAIVALRLEHPPNADGWSAQAEAAKAFDAFDRIGAIRAPTLIVQGTEDGVVDPRNSELLLRRIPGARRELLSGIGHLTYWEAPERFADLVTAFLAGEDAR